MSQQLVRPQLGRIYQGDCLELMRQWPDKCFDLVLTDPPYGIDYGAKLKGKGDGAGGADKHGWKDYGAPDWDKQRPSREVFDEIRRISKAQIIWGGNYFADLLPATMGWLVWDKGQRDFSLADGELAWTSFQKALRIFTFPRSAALRDGKVHPTQKPVDLIAWCLNVIGTSEMGGGYTVCDPFLGSGTTALVCEKMGLSWVGVEREPKYVKIAQRRVDEERAQGKLF